MSYTGARATRQDMLTNAARSTSGNYVVRAPRGALRVELGEYGPPYLIAPVLGSLGAITGGAKPVPSGSAWLKANTDAANLVRGMGLTGIINALPFSSADKAKILNTPLEAVLDIFDPLEDALANFIVSYRKSNAAIFGGTALKQTWRNPFTGSTFVIDFRPVQPGDEKLDALTLAQVKRLRLMSTVGLLSMTDPFFGPALLVAVFGGILESAFDAVNAFFGRGDVRLQQVSSSVPKGTAINSHKNEPAALLQSCGWGQQTSTPDGIEVWNFFLPFTRAQAGYARTGTVSDPVGGVGGFGEDGQAFLQKLVKAGVTFKAPPGRDSSTITADGMFQIGSLNGEGYVFVLGSDGNFYKFKKPGTGIGYWAAHGMPDVGMFDNAATKASKLAARANHLRGWLNGVVTASSPRMPAIVGAAGLTRYYFALGDKRDVATNASKSLGHYSARHYSASGLGVDPVSDAAAATAVTTGVGGAVATAAATAPAWLEPTLKFTTALINAATPVVVGIVKASGQQQPVQAPPTPPVQQASSSVLPWILGGAGVLAVVGLVFASRD